MTTGIDLGYRVGEIAKLAGVTIRTLHHYEAIGLLVPGHRSNAGYRLYTDTHVERLSRVLYYRELGFPLTEIATLLDDDGVPTLEHLERQHRLLAGRLHRVQAMVAALEREMEAHMKGHNLTAEEKLEVFGDFDPDQYHDEARERWGDTDAWRQSQERGKSYSKEQWKLIQVDMDGLNARFAAAMEAGIPAESTEGMDLAEEHRAMITRWFYDCSVEVHRGLGDLYVTDPRFADNIDKVAAGLAAYLRDAFAANANRQEG